MIRRGTLLLLAPALLWACAVGVPELRYLQLSDGGVQPGRGSSPEVFLEAVGLPDFLLRDELLLRLDEHQLDYDYARRWAEPLDLAIQRVLARQLAARLDTARMHRFPAPRPRREHWKVDIAIDHFEIHGEDLRIAVTATLTAPGADALQTLRFEERQPTPADPPAIAASMSQLLAEFAEALAGAIRSG